MNNNDNLLKKTDIEKIATEGQAIYSKIKARYEPEKNGRYLAIEIDSKEVFLGKTGVEATIKARNKYPNKVFYLVKIGFTAAETIARTYFR